MLVKILRGRSRTKKVGILVLNLNTLVANLNILIFYTWYGIGKLKDILVLNLNILHDPCFPARVILVLNLNTNKKYRWRGNRKECEGWYLEEHTKHLMEILTQTAATDREKINRTEINSRNIHRSRCCKPGTNQRTTGSIRWCCHPLPTRMSPATPKAKSWSKKH
jgi:hypothetical protein